MCLKVELTLFLWLSMITMSDTFSRPSTNHAHVANLLLAATWHTFANSLINTTEISINMLKIFVG